MCYTPVRVNGSVGDQLASPVHLSTISSRCWAWQNSPPSLANAIQVQPKRGRETARECDVLLLIGRHSVAVTRGYILTVMSAEEIVH